MKLHAVIHMSSGDKMAPFLASDVEWVCHVATFIEPILNGTDVFVCYLIAELANFI